MGDAIAPGRNAAHQSNEDIEDVEDSTLYLEDHPSGCRWLITMAASFSSPRNRVVGPLPNGLSLNDL